MKIWNVTESEIREAAEAAGVAIHSDWNHTGIVRDGRALRFRLALGTERQEDASLKNPPLKWQRHSPEGWRENVRRIAAVCWHGHYAFMSEVFSRQPDARIWTSWADYRGRTDFFVKAEPTGDLNIGSMMYPCCARDACYCDQYGDGQPEVYDRLTPLEPVQPDPMAGRVNYDPVRGA